MFILYNINYIIKTMIQDQTEDAKSCKNHPYSKAEFFVVEQPWIKLCKECALNLALCGKKIDKDMTPNEFQNKIVIVGLVEELKKTIENCDRQSKDLGEHTKKIDKVYLDQISQKLKQLDQFIRELNKIRDSFHQLYEEHISQNINQLYDQQNKLLVQSVGLKKHLENIQVNYCDYIMQIQNQTEQFEKNNEIIRNDLEKTKKALMGDVDKMEINLKIQQIRKAFNDKFNELKDKKFVLFESKSNPTGDDAKVRFSENEGISCRQTFKTREDSARKFFSHRKSMNENKPTLQQSQTCRAKLSLRSNSKKPNSNHSSKNSTMRKPRQSIKDITNLEGLPQLG